MGFFSGLLDTVGSIAGPIISGISSVSNALAPIAPLAGGLIAGGLGYAGQQQANSANAASVQAQIDFQKQQSATQYQRAVTDMTAAGINPMLASQVGGNASMAGASTTFGNAGSAAVSSGASGAMLSASIDKIKADTAVSDSQALVNTLQASKIKQDTITSSVMADKYQSEVALNSVEYNRVLRMADKIAVDTGLSSAQTDLVKSQIKNAYYTGSQILANTGNIQADTVLKKLNASRATAESKFYSDMGSSAYSAQFGAGIIHDLATSVPRFGR